MCSLRLRSTTASEGDTAVLSSMRSPKCESSSVPICISKETGFCAIFLSLAHLRNRDPQPLGKFLGCGVAAQLAD